MKPQFSNFDLCKNTGKYQSSNGSQPDDINTNTSEQFFFGVVQSIQMQGQNIKSSTAANRTQEQYTIVQQYPTSHKKSAIKTMEHKTNDITDDDLETTRI
ncbi:uncharacterized protein LOC117188970 isoform X3 [Drosophila miranda]|uniref:uncharacterized protein LOC117188970 isoform X3 n=1 Tax=Drosophila miranda TaxID=7229 RepID=UPI00143F1198|nr:uncharacterized protein LOC117188970 isoform X3 [Drosophila miranda]